MKINFKNKIEIVKVAVLAVLFTAVIASSWTGPTNSQPSGYNAPLPINTSSLSQTKNGALNVDGVLRANGRAIVNVNGATSPPGSGLWPLEVYNGSGSTGGTIFGGGVLLSGNGIVGLSNIANATTPNSTFDVYGDAKITSLSSANNPTVTYSPNAKICADTNGVLMVCGTIPPPPPLDVCLNIPGNQATVPLGYYQSGTDCLLIPTGKVVYTRNSSGNVTYSVVSGSCPSCTNSSFVLPSGSGNVTFKIWGAGGGGGGYDENPSILNGAGGGGGGYTQTTTLISSPVPVVVGSAGTMGTNADFNSQIFFGTPGGDGGNSSVVLFGTAYKANGGGGGSNGGGVCWQGGGGNCSVGGGFLNGIGVVGNNGAHGGDNGLGEGGVGIYGYGAGGSEHFGTQAEPGRIEIIW